MTDLKDLIITSIAASSGIGVMFVFGLQLFLKRYLDARSKRDYNNERREAELSQMRASYEAKIADLSREMVATRERWIDANHLLITGQRHQPEHLVQRVIDPEGFIKSYGINPQDIQVNPRQVFVLTPFLESERKVFSAIKAVCDRVGYVAVRGDELRAEGEILPQIVSGIVGSRIIIANISGRNPNVFFELGIAMALGKQTILVSDTMSDVPFDVMARRIVFYKDLDDLSSLLPEVMLRAIGSKV